MLSEITTAKSPINLRKHSGVTWKSRQRFLKQSQLKYTELGIPQHDATKVSNKRSNLAPICLLLRPLASSETHAREKFIHYYFGQDGYLVKKYI
jgi:hypothetical protein